MVRRPLRVGTRGSPLARAQTDEGCRHLVAACPDLAEAGALETVVIRTTGDVVQDRPLSEVGGKGLFTKEIDEAMLGRRIDLAVHSVKDLPTWLPAGIVLGAVLPRADPRDVFVSPGAGGLAGLPLGAVVGTASLRRQAQVLARRPDVQVVPLRGNVQTRLAKVDRGVVHATLLARAGIVRLGLMDVAAVLMATEEMLPAVGQGAIGITCRADDSDARSLLARVDHPASRLEVAAERAMLAVLDGSCRTPIAGLARTDDGRALDLRGLIARPDGTRVIDGHRDGVTAADAEAAGHDLGRELKRRGGPGFFTRP